jgi:hypothetical protein
MLFVIFRLAKFIHDFSTEATTTIDFVIIPEYFLKLDQIQKNGQLLLHVTTSVRLILRINKQGFTVKINKLT